MLITLLIMLFFCYYSDMNYDDQLGSDLLQQPLLSAETIPELIDEESIQKPAIIQSNIILQNTSSSNALNVLSNSVVVNSGIVHIKNDIVEATVKPTVQFVKKIPSKVIQISGESNQSTKLNKTIITENGVVSNGPIVINKVNANISGKLEFIKAKLCSSILI